MDGPANAQPDWLAYIQGRGQSYSPYAGGNKVYGVGSPAPNIGPSDPSGYQIRDQKATYMRNALLQRMQSQQAGNYASPQAQRPIGSLYPGPGGF